MTYDALKVNGSTYIKDANDAFSAIWPENVGLFVVTVGQGDVNISTGIESNKERNVKANEKSIKNLQNGAIDVNEQGGLIVKTIDESGNGETVELSSGEITVRVKTSVYHKAKNFAQR